MSDPLFCIAALFFLGWVIYLKFQISDLKNENEKIKSALQEKVGRLKRDVEVGDNVPASWGRKPDQPH